MKLTIDDIFKYSFVISIDQNRLNVLYKIFNANSLPLPIYFKGFVDKDLSGKKKCGLSHLAIVKMAKYSNLPYVAIFEDDAYPRKDIMQDLALELSDIPDNIGIILLGWNKLFSPSFQNAKMTQLETKCYGSHSYIIFKSCYDAFITAYEQKTYNNHIDNIFEAIIQMNNCIMHTSKPYFIQYSGYKSLNKHIGYTLDGKDNYLPPSGFLPIDTYFTDPFINKENLKQFVEDINLNTNNKKKCIIIGSNPSLKKCLAANYIDNDNSKFKIRINRHPADNLIKYYGKRTDVYSCCKINFDPYIKNKNKKQFIITDKHIKLISKDFYPYTDNTWLTTGFMTILLCLQIFDSVEIFGFGCSNTKEDDIKYVSVNETVEKTHHNINYEHMIIDKWISTLYKGRLFRLEDTFKY